MISKKNDKLNSEIKLSNNSYFVFLRFAIFKFRNIGRSNFLPLPEFELRIDRISSFKKRLLLKR